MLFWDQFLNICRSNHIAPTKALKINGISQGNMVRWKNGGSVNSKTIEKLAKYFGVPAGYFLTNSFEIDVREGSSCQYSKRK